VGLKSGAVIKLFSDVHTTGIELPTGDKSVCWQRVLGSHSEAEAKC